MQSNRAWLLGFETASPCLFLFLQYVQLDGLTAVPCVTQKSYLLKVYIGGPEPNRDVLFYHTSDSVLLPVLHLANRAVASSRNPFHP